MHTIEKGLLIRWNGNVEDANIPEGVTTIGKGLFRGNPVIRSISFQESLRTIGDFPLRIVARWSVWRYRTA